MKVKIYLTVEGQERYVNNPEARLYSWNFMVETPEGGEVDPKSVLLAEVDLVLPALEVASVNAVEALKARRAEVYAEAERDVQNLNVRIQNLLAITYEA